MRMLETKIQEIQAKILSEGMESNPLLKPHVIPILNKGLNTKEKDSLVRAINEIEREVSINKKTTTQMIIDITSIVGDWVDDRELHNEFLEYADNLMDGIIDLNKKIGTDGLKRSIVFYMQEIMDIGQSVSVFVPYKGKVTNVHTYVGSELEVPTEIEIEGLSRDIRMNISEGMVSKTSRLSGTVDNNLVTVRVIGGDEGVNNLNVVVDFIQDKAK